MDYRSAWAISAAGMGYEKSRLETAALNLANMNTTSAPGTPGYQPMRATAAPLQLDFGRLLAGVAFQAAGTGLTREVRWLPTGAPPRLVSDPGHPHADERGMVRMPGVDQATEMITAMTALRAYEANVAAAGLARTMAARALELGGT